MRKQMFRKLCIACAAGLAAFDIYYSDEFQLLEKAFGIIDQAMDDYENDRIPDEVLKYKAGW